MLHTIVDTPSAWAPDETMMRRAIALAVKGTGWTNPNPLVGCVVVKDGRVIGEGYHARYGHAHAERIALANCTESAAGATLYVTLEPCCHQGKQPPCTNAIVEAGVARVVVGSRDPNPLVSGKGNAILRAAGITVTEDFLRAECDALNPVFFHYIQTQRPYVVAKWAMTLDGKIATFNGDSHWISNELSRADVHELRHRYAAIMVGKGTVKADDPLLNARRKQPSSQPLRIVVDARLETPLSSKLVQTAHEAPVIVATAQPTDSKQAQALESTGVQVVSIPDSQGKVNLHGLMNELGKRDIDSLLVEGGGGLHEAMYQAHLVDQTIVYLAPKVVGGAQAKTPVEGRGIEHMADALFLGEPVVERFGTDLKLTYLHDTLAGKGDARCSQA